MPTVQETLTKLVGQPAQESIKRILSNKNLNEWTFPLRGRVIRKAVNRTSRDSYIDLDVKGERVSVQFLKQRGGKDIHTAIFATDGADGLKDFVTQDKKAMLLAWMYAVEVYLAEIEMMDDKGSFVRIIFDDNQGFGANSIKQLADHLANRRWDNRGDDWGVQIIGGKVILNYWDASGPIDLA